MYMVFVEDSMRYRDCILQTDDRFKAIAEMEWNNAHDPDKRKFGVVEIS